MGRYENIVIINPDCSKEEEEELMRRIKATMERTGVSIIKEDDWTVRKLAYPIKKKDRGHYFFFLLDMDTKNVSGLNRYYRSLDNVLRHLFVRVSEKEKGPEKVPDQVVFDELEGEFL
ncbi:MAG TPA: 30S ribosomal protein S6 [Deltaproteobacteria bacterium]|nr:30S ribosomal protein S6 [Deltaproteobacteria bacterium]